MIILICFAILVMLSLVLVGAFLAVVGFNAYRLAQRPIVKILGALEALVAFAVACSALAVTAQLAAFLVQWVK